MKKLLQSEFVEENNELLQKTKLQIDEYFSEERKEFDIPILLVGSDFQKQVWNALLKIPYGKAFSYLNLAKSINNEKAVRAVASANGENSISLIVPCHRIIGSNGELVGYAGGLSANKKILSLESEDIQLSLNI